MHGRAQGLGGPGPGPGPSISGPVWVACERTAVAARKIAYRRLDWCIQNRGSMESLGWGHQASSDLGSSVPAFSGNSSR